MSTTLATNHYNQASTEEHELKKFLPDGQFFFPVFLKCPIRPVQQTWYKGKGDEWVNHFKIDRM